MWDAAQYLRFADERSRPFSDLLARVRAERPRYVADLGCGPGHLTAALARRWPDAEVEGIDSSGQMIAAARAAAYPGVSFTLGDIRDWVPERAPDVITCNAVLQWVPGHEHLLGRWADALAPGGWLAFQLPGNFGSPSHVIAAELASSPRWRGLTGGAALNRQGGDPARYAGLLARDGYEIDAWETTYLHILRGDNPVAEWAKGTTLRPLLALLDEEQAAAFLAEYAERVRDAYRRGSFGVIFPFRRVFAVLHRLAPPLP
jgi:trans-aconitate 2-methyltransferase